MLVALLPTLKVFQSVELNLEVIEAAALNCSLKKVLSNILKNSQVYTTAGASFLKNNSSTIVFPGILLIIQNPSFEGCQSMAASESTIQNNNNPSKSRKHSREISAPEFCYSETIGIAFRTNFAYQSDINYDSINFWSLFNLKELTQSLYRQSVKNHIL